MLGIGSGLVLASLTANHMPVLFLPPLCPPSHPQVAYHDEYGSLVTDRRLIASHYAEWRLWVDLGTTIPFDWCVWGGREVPVEGLRRDQRT